MEEKIKLRLLLSYIVFYVFIFTIISIINKNYEFLYYTIIISLLIIVISLYYKKIHLHYHLLVALTMVGSLHILGGALHINGTRLYDIWIIEEILKYDNIVHIFGAFAATLVAYNILSPHLDLKVKHHHVLFLILLVFISLGIGSFNEILEFFAVIFLNASKQVGDYTNNALDLVFNLIGSAIASYSIFHFYHNKRITQKNAQKIL